MRTMTKVALLIGGAALAAALIGSVAGAQSPTLLYPKWHFGLSAGANLADMTDTEGADMRTGMLVGASLSVQLTEKFSLQPELYYSQKGVKGSFVDEESGTPVDVTLKNDYIEVPLLARWTFGRLDTPVRPFVVGGPSLGLSASCKGEGEADGVSASIDCDRFASMNNFELGGVAGVGLAFPVGRNAMTVSTRYTVGFSKVFDEADSRNRALSFLVGFVF